MHRPFLNFRYLGLILLLAMASALPAQVTGILRGPDGNPMEGIEVFFNRTTIRAKSNELGQFSLDNVPVGFLEIVAYKKGYALYRAPMRVQEGRSYNLNLQLKETEKKSKGKTSAEQVADFSRALLGTGGLLTFENERQILVEVKEGKYLVRSGPVIAEYPNAGYRIMCYFSSTQFQNISEAAYSYQEYQLPDVNQSIAFEKNRMVLYRGSLKHFFMALVVNKAKDEGFSMEDEQGLPVEGPGLVTPASAAGYYRIKIDQPLIVKYGKTAPSVLTTTGPIDVNKLGILINPKLLTLKGSMSNHGLENQLPLDYLPIAGDIESSFAEALKRFYEKIYIQTDKPYYYPGEPLWFKAYINYYHTAWRDSLSDVLHVEVIDSARKVLMQHMFRIQKGTAHGDFIFPDTLKPGTYYLRGFTSLRRNFTDEHLFTKPLQVLNMLDKVDPAQQQPPVSTQSLAISPYEKSYKVREEVILDLITKDTQGKPVASFLSIAVTDAAQVIAVPEATTITKEYPIAPEEIASINELKYRIERGVSFYGQFLNNKRVGEKTQLTFIQWNTGDILSAGTDDNGRFWQTGLQFTDSAQFSYKSDKAKGRPYGKVTILPREIPPLQVPNATPLTLIKAGTVQRIISEYEVPKGNKLLEEVEITAARIDKDFEQAKSRPYGRADHVITKNTLNVATGNLLYALVGKVPGLVVNPTMGYVYFARASASSISVQTSPMVTLNDVPMSGDPATILQSIDPNIVESIEFTSRLNSSYGAQGAFGVISIYTKSGVSVDNTDPNFQIVKLPGFSKARKFKAPEYSDPKTDADQADYRATLYWNPVVETDPVKGSAHVSFFASDLPGLYRVVVEGVTAEGTPIRSELYLTIDEKH